MKPIPKTQSLKERSAWLLGAKLTAFALSFFLPLLIVRQLSQDDVGVFRESFLIVMNAVAVLPLGFSMSAYYFLARETERRAAAILNILLFNFVVGGLGCLALWIYPQMLGGVFGSDELTRLAPAIGVVIWIWIFSTFLETVAIANQETRLATAFIILAQFSKTVFMGTAVLAFATVESLIYAALAQGVIQIVILLLYLRSRFPGFWRQFDRAFFREQMVYTIPFGLTGILWIAQTDLHNYFVVYKFSSADFAIYAYGCFQLPLIGMLSESISSVLIPRMGELQRAGRRDEIIRLTARAMQKLAFFYLPIYVFLSITAHTFITTLFTQKYEASTSVFVINLTLLPLGVLIIDPIARSFAELGKIFLVTRIVVLAGLIGVLYLRLDSIGLTGVIAVAVGAIVIEKLVTAAIVARKLGVGTHHLHLMGSIGKTALISLAAGLVTYFVHLNARVPLLEAGERFATGALSTTNRGAIDFFSGGLVLLVCGCVFATIYLVAASVSGVIEEHEKSDLRRFVLRLTPGRAAAPLVNTEG